MKLKYYLRGIGIGIIFASIIFFAAYRENVSSKISDDEIKARAKELGMVEADAPINELISNNSKDETSSESITEDTSKESSEENMEKSSDASTEEKTENDDKNGSEKISESSEKASTEKVTESSDKNNTDKVSEETDKSSEEKTTESSDNASTEKAAEEKNKSGTEASTEASAKKDLTDTIEITIAKGSSSYPVCQKLQELGIIDDAAKFDDYLIEKGYANRISVGTHKLNKGMDYHTIAELISDPL